MFSSSKSKLSLSANEWKISNPVELNLSPPFLPEIPSVNSECVKFENIILKFIYIPDASALPTLWYNGECEKWEEWSTLQEQQRQVYTLLANSKASGTPRAQGRMALLKQEYSEAQQEDQDASTIEPSRLHRIWDTIRPDQCLVLPKSKLSQSKSTS
ncbi:hypothetical protein GLAREA_12394 [Glarea lozoyensis ATCC 20868]|uniref:Uncharacterized protein n=1 Tax=Glarea lozoyensis (strain ATCC 20868 / MF5171) TaxID=1116229 RepID=S3DZ77_GLAL2|nr:uncharacterized protein GLAREA_12394 [Glarea lozoyensis ATCC 20868]EPE31638.1 hypothetical protein GLAREA_12394 [Glarea lozoyensis ATCC 20868]